jgi:hypothetical protein
MMGDTAALEDCGKPSGFLVWGALTGIGPTTRVRRGFAAMRPEQVSLALRFSQ